MKLNWGWSITLAIVLFMSFILYFVIKVQSNSEYDNELVADDYYKQEIEFQQEIDKTKNANLLTDKVSITTTKEGVLIVFPSDLEPKNIIGKVSLYRPSNQKLDIEIPISISTSHLLIPNSEMVGGRWDISIDWSYEGKSYFSKKSINY